MQSVKDLVPMRVRRAIAASRTAWGDHSFWKGVYSSFSDVPSFGDGFSGPSWGAETAHAFESMERYLVDDPLGTTWRYAHHELLGLVLASMFPANKGIRVLDFGGGMGPDYLHLLSGLAHQEVIDYTIVDSAEIKHRAEGLGIPQRHPRLRFASGLSEISEPVDFINANAVMQYIEDWKGVIHLLAEKRAKSMLFSRLPLGAFSTYASGQTNHAPSVVPCWFFNKDEFISTLKEASYELRFFGVHDRVYDHSSVPPSYRCTKRSYALFERVGV